VADQSYRDLYDEVATLRGEMDAANQRILNLRARKDRACEQRDMWRVMHHEVEVERDLAIGRWQGLVKELDIHDEWEPFIEPPERRVAAYVKNAIRDAEAQRGKQKHLVREVEFWKEQRDLAANVAAGIADLDEVAPALRQVLRTERERRKRSEDENDRLAYAATRVVQLVTHGADGLVVGGAIAEMRRVLDGGGK